ncbi:hypothetical protein [Nocardia sp. NPDC005366]|uniref:hypothetical protein n=1 Tax=Nocardia sp. NPDC005366 TaxID=3156878 RepID=UPI0033B41472
MATEFAERPQHDPVSEDADLMTIKEGVARVYDGLEIARNNVTALEAAGAPQEDIDFARRRVELFVEGLERAQERVEPDYKRRV